MTQFAWYCPELNIITLQSFMDDDSAIAFGWDGEDAFMVTQLLGDDVDPMGAFAWVPLGEL